MLYDIQEASTVLKEAVPAPSLKNAEHQHARNLLSAIAGAAAIAGFRASLDGDRVELRSPGGAVVTIDYVPDDPTFTIGRDDRGKHDDGWAMPVVLDPVRGHLRGINDDGAEDALVAIARYIRRMLGPYENFGLGHSPE